MKWIAAQVIALCVSVSFAISAWAEISVNKAIIEFLPDGEYFSDVKVSNSSSQSAYVAASVQEVIRPGQSEENKVSAATPDQALLIATPLRLVIPGHQAAPIRLLSLDETLKHEKVYRVTISPAKGKDKATSSGVRLIVAYDLLVLVRPRKPVVTIRAQRKNELMVFYNQGNTSVILADGKQCPVKKKASNRACQPVKAFRLYAGASYAVPVDKENTVAFEVESASGRVHQVFEGKDSLPKAAMDEALKLRAKIMKKK